MSQQSASGNSTAGQAGGAGYAGDVDVAEAWEALKSEPDAVLVDVRTKAEWNFVGIPDLSETGKEPVLVEWQVFPTMETNGAFVDSVSAAVPKRDARIYFLCRTGGRSKAAAIAMTQAGYAHCFNVSDGFEGPHDARQHRGTSRGWKASGLPWVQG